MAAQNITVKTIQAVLVLADEIRKEQSKIGLIDPDDVYVIISDDKMLPFIEAYSEVMEQKNISSVEMFQVDFEERTGIGLLMPESNSKLILAPISKENMLHMVNRARHVIIIVENDHVKEMMFPDQYYLTGVYLN